MMDNQTWFKDIKPFVWEELDGKTLQIRAGKQEGVLIVVGYDQETKDIFVLHDGKAADPIPLPTIKPGDEVLVVKGPFAGRKIIVSANHAHKRNISTKIDGELWGIHYDDLEVSHD